MSKISYRIILFVILTFIPVLDVFAQAGAYSSYSPYSVFGIGDISKVSTAYSNGMGGVGIAGRDNRYLNYMNPASVTAMDTLSFMMDFGLYSQNKIFRQGNLKSANNSFNISNIAFSAPIYKKSAMVFGICPFSNVGYNFSSNKVDPEYAVLSYSSAGDGSIYQLFGGAGVTLWKHLSIGAQAIYYFGNINKKTNMDFLGSSFRDISSGYIVQLDGFAGKFGLQYEIPIKDMYMTIGATYRTGSRLGGYVREYKMATLSKITDTLKYNIDTLANTRKVRIASEFGVGISFHKPEKWNLEVNYTYSDWTRSGFDTTVGFANEGESKFSTTFSQSIRAGFEYIPNRNDIRYYMRRCAYRVGAYYDKDYYKLDGKTINSFGLTFGFTLPVFRLYNGMSFGLELGQRGSLSGNMTRERYMSFSVGFNIHDIWFRKHRYE